MYNIKSYFFVNITLCCDFIAIIVTQILKTIFFYISKRKFDISRLIETGGMPSSHSACVVALAAAISKECGVRSPAFAISAVLAIIVMYDASGVRKSSGDQAKILNKLIDILDIPEIKQVEIKKKLKIFNKENNDYCGNMKILKEQLGHTIVEVLAGGFIGLLVSLVF